MSPPIVVGVDGSTGAQRALMWALSEARRLNAPVHVVHAWWTPPEHTELGWVTRTTEDDADRRKADEELMARMLEESGPAAEDVDQLVQHATCPMTVVPPAT